MKNMKLSQQLGWGFGSLVALLVILSAAAIWSINGSSSGFHRYSSSVVKTDGSWEMQDDLSQVQINMMLNLSTHDSTYLAAAKEIEQELMADLRKLVEEAETAESKRGYQETIGLLEAYEKSFVRVDALWEKRNSLLNPMISQGETMVALLDEAMGDFTRDNNIRLLGLAAQAQKDLLFGRLHVNKYLDGNTEEQYAAGVKALGDSELGQRITTLAAQVEDPEIQDDFRQFEAARLAYVTGLTALHGVLLERNTAIGAALEDLAPKVTAKLEAFKNGYRKEQLDIEQEVAKIDRLGFILMAVLAVLAIILGIAMTLYITRLVRKPIGGEPMEIDRMAQQIAKGDLTAEFSRTGNETGIYAAMRSMNDQLTRVVSEVVTASSSVSSASSQIAAGSQDLSQRTEEQASSLEETAASIEEMASTVTGSADNALEATKLAEGARDNAVKGGAVVQEAIKAMGDISQASNQIKDIIEVIEGITFQTNLLSLNASVEAARAGEQGRGFAVVAAEVGKLASKSADAAKDIKGLINTAVSKVESGALLVNRSGEALSEIIASVTRVTDIVNEMAAAAQEQATGISQVNKAVTQMDEVTQHNSSLVEETAAAAETLKEQAAHLQSLMGFFTVAAGSGSVPRSMPVTEPSSKQPAPAPRKPASKKSVTDGDDWSEF